MTGGRKCQGLTGRLFGHKFNDRHWATESWYNTNHCQRCGMPKGGWK